MGLLGQAPRKVECCYDGCASLPESDHHSCAFHTGFYAQVASDIKDDSIRRSVVKRTKAIRPRLCRADDCDEPRAPGAVFCETHDADV